MFLVNCIALIHYSWYYKKTDSSNDIYAKKAAHKAHNGCEASQVKKERAQKGTLEEKVKVMYPQNDPKKFRVVFYLWYTNLMSDPRVLIIGVSILGITASASFAVDEFQIVSHQATQTQRNIFPFFKNGAIVNSEQAPSTEYIIQSLQ